VAFLAVIGLIASFHTIIYAYGRICSLCRARSSQRPVCLAQCRIASTPTLLAIMLVVWFRGAEGWCALIGGTLLNMAVFAR
jgi:ethanolamine permease